MQGFHLFLNESNLQIKKKNPRSILIMTNIQLLKDCGRKRAPETGPGLSAQVYREYTG